MDGMTTAESRRDRNGQRVRYGVPTGDPMPPLLAIAALCAAAAAFAPALFGVFDRAR